MRASLTVLVVWLLEGIRMVYLEKQSTKRRKRAHNIDGQCIPRALGLDGAGRLLVVAIIGAQLAMGATLSGLQADAAAGFVGVPVTEKLPQSMATEVGSGVEFTGDFPGFVFILY